MAALDARRGVRAREHTELQNLLDAVVRYLGSQDFELLRSEREVVVPGER